MWDIPAEHFILLEPQTYKSGQSCFKLFLRPLLSFHILIGNDGLDHMAAVETIVSAQVLVYFEDLLLGNVCLKRLDFLDLRPNLKPLSGFSKSFGYTFQSQECKSPDCFPGLGSMWFSEQPSALFYSWKNC